MPVTDFVSGCFGDASTDLLQYNDEPVPQLKSGHSAFANFS